MRNILLALALWALASSACAAPPQGEPPPPPIGTGVSGVLAPYPLTYYSGPCDILAKATAPCVAAHSVTRRLLGSYTGPLFDLQRTSDSAILHVGTLSYGLVDTSGVAAFCSGTTCNFAIVYDQTANHNDLPVTPAAASTQPLYVVSGITGLPIVMSDLGQSSPATCTGSCTYLRNRAATTNIPTGNALITEYDVRTTENYSKCAGEYGNVENTVADTGTYHMFEMTFWNSAGTCVTSTGAPYVGIDHENGGFFVNPGNNPYLLTTLAKNDTTNVTIKYAPFPGQLMQVYKAASPTFVLEGGLSLGEGGDATPGYSSFEEGIVAARATTDATDTAIQSNIAAFYTVPVNVCSLGYCGPGDIFPSATGWYGLRAYNQADRGNRVINACLPSSSNCADMSTDPVTGALVVTAITGTSCNNTTVICTVAKIYERSGGGAPDLAQATQANQPTLVLNCTPNGQPCLAFTATQSLLATSGVPSMTQPITMAGVFMRTGGQAAFSNLMLIGNPANGNNLQMGGWNVWNMFGAGRDTTSDGIPVSSTDNYFNSVSVTFNSTATAIHINAGNIPYTIAGTNPSTTSLSIGAPSGLSTGLVGKFTETGIWAGVISSAQWRALGANPRTFYGF